MFLIDTEANFTSLFQGDVIKDVPLVGTLDLDKVAPVGSQAWAHALPLKHGPCVVVSHSCEVALENGEKVTSCILAPVRTADGATTKELFEILKRNAVEPDEKNFLKYFYIEPNDKLPNANGSLVDFSKIFSVRKTSIAQLIEKKILQMKEDERVKLARKVGLYFYRGK